MHRPLFQHGILRALRFLALLALSSTLAFAADDRPLPEIYAEAKTALEAGNAARCVELLEPALKDTTAEAAAPAQLALGLAYLKLTKPEPAAAALQKASPHFAGKPESANVAAPLGDALRVLGKSAESRDAYTAAQTAAPQSINGRYAAARLSELRGEASEAARDFPPAAAAYLAAAESFLALGTEDPAYLTEARAIYERVAKGTPKDKVLGGWRGEATARAVFGMGEVERARGQLPEALAYYQRTFVSWSSYPKVAAVAYLRAAESMDKLGKRDFAIRHLRELVRKIEKYGKLPEYEQAKKQLRAWGEDIR